MSFSLQLSSSGVSNLQAETISRSMQNLYSMIVLTHWLASSTCQTEGVLGTSMILGMTLRFQLKLCEIWLLFLNLTAKLAKSLIILIWLPVSSDFSYFDYIVVETHKTALNF